MLAAFADLMREVEVVRETSNARGDPPTLTVTARLPMSIQANRRRAQGAAGDGTALGVAAYLAYCAPHPEVTRPGFKLRAADGSVYEPETDALDIGGQGEVLVIPLKAPQGRQG